MAGRRRALSDANGAFDAPVLVVAEAPGRFGAERHGTPLTGDATGRNFNALLAAAGLNREFLFITNSVLCNPRDERGNNAPPSAAELASCRDHLTATIDTIDPKVVLALGRVALRALHAVAPHDARFPADVGRAIDWHHRVLVPLYHPGPRAQLHRAFAQQVEDMRRAAEIVRRACLE
jgi:uracil-DNA glycosylase family 4